MNDMTSQRDAAILGRRIVWGIRRHARPGAQRVAVRALTVAALVVLGIGGASAATDSGPSFSVAPVQAARGQVLSEAVRATSQRTSKADDDKRRPAARDGTKIAARWGASDAVWTGQRWPFRADPRRWPRLFANTTACTLSLDPITGRHWWQ